MFHQFVTCNGKVFLSVCEAPSNPGRVFVQVFALVILVSAICVGKKNGITVVREPHPAVSTMKHTQTGRD